MRITSLTVGLLLIILLGCDTASSVDPIFENFFIKYYGADGNQEGVDLLVTDDASMILLGNSYNQTDSKSPFIVKTDIDGNVLWQRQLGGQNETAVDVELVTAGAHQGKLVVVSNIDETGDSRVRITVLDQGGKGVDSLVYPSTGWLRAKTVTIGSDNSFLVSGAALPDPARNIFNPPVPDFADVVVVKIDQSFDTAEELSRQGGETVGSAVKTFEVVLQDSLKYAQLGYSDRPRSKGGTFEQNFEVIVVNKFGTERDRSTTGTTNEAEKASAAIFTPPKVVDGANIEQSYLIVGTSYPSASALYGYIYVSRFNKTLDAEGLNAKLLTTKGGRYEGIAAANAPTGGYIVVGNEYADDNRSNIYLVQIQQDGSEKWSTTFGAADGDDRAGAVAALPDGRIAVLGTMDLETQKKIALIIVTDQGSFSN